MMKERLMDEMKTAMKSGDSFALGILRMVIAAVNAKSIEKRGKGLPPEMSDEEIIEELVKVKGIGEWTAQMFLMFRLGRPDVLPDGDLGIRKAQSIADKYGREQENKNPPRQHHDMEPVLRDLPIRMTTIQEWVVQHAADFASAN